MSESERKQNRIAKWGTAAAIGFLAFAPPGTMIFIGLFFAWLFSDHWMIAVPILLILFALSVFLFLRHRRKA